MSSSKSNPALIQVPNLFSVVEQGVYRCVSPTPAQIPFLATLGLKTILSLTPEHPTKPFLNFVRSSAIDFIHLGTILFRPRVDWKPILDEVVKAALEILLDVRNHPVLLIDPLGIHQTGCVVGSLRSLQGWNFASTLVEYRAHSGPTKHRLEDEQYIELFDPELINLPPHEFRPSWLRVDIGDSGSDDTDYDAEEEQEEQEAMQPDEDRQRTKTEDREVNGSIPSESDKAAGRVLGQDGPTAQDLGYGSSTGVG